MPDPAGVAAPEQLPDAAPEPADDLLHVVCCKPEVVLGSEPVIALCGRDCTDEPLYPTDAGHVVCPLCEQLARRARADPLGCQSVCPALRWS